jgi:8-oxo-dGTP pyrophosphatase MutT (NUDIX family)
MPTLERIRGRLAGYEPRLVSRSGEGLLEAAVAVVLHEPAPGVPEILLIERAEREGDPWSGHMAFPGGRREPGDPTLERTASRETLEEVGFQPDLPIARLDDVEGSNAARPGRLVIATFVYEVAERPLLVQSHEVRSTIWVPAWELLDPRVHTRYRFRRGDYEGEFPAIHYSGYTVWGLTYRVLRRLFEVLERPLPEP